MRRLVELLFLAIIVAAPWMRGAFFRSPQATLYAGLSLVCFLRIAFPATPSRVDGRLPLAFWAALLGVPLALLQLIPFAQQHWATRTSATANLRSPPAELPKLLIGAADPGAVQNDAESDRRSPLSIAPSRTLDQLSQLIAACCVVLLTVELFPTVRDRRRFLIVVVVNGVALAFVALAQRLGDRTFVIWEPHSNWLGPFANRNNGAGYLNLCLAACFGLLWQHVQRRLEPTSRESPPIQTGWRSLLDATTLALIAAAVLMITAVAASLSRGAIVSLVVGVIVTSVAVAAVRGRRFVLPAVAVCLLAAAAVVFWLRLDQSISNRLESLTDSAQVLQDGRLANWRWGMQAAVAFFPWGSGLGTYVYAYQPFQQRAAAERFLFPENAALQTCVEAGLAGIGLLTIGVTSAFVAAFVRTRRRADPQLMFLGVVGLFFLTTTLVQSCCDNGFYLPANFLLIAALCGATCGGCLENASAEPNPRGASEDSTRVTWQNALRRGLVGAALLGTAWAARHQYSLAPVDQAFRGAESLSERTDLPVDEITQHLSELERTAVPGSGGFVSRRIAELYLYLHHRRSADELVSTDLTLSARRAWDATAIASLYATAVRFEREGDRNGLQSLRNHPLTLRYLIPAWDRLHEAHIAAPFDAATVVELGELAFLVGPPSQGLPWIAKAAELAPADAALAYRAGGDLLAGGDRAHGFAALRRCWSLNGAFQDSICSLVPVWMSLDELVEQVLPETADAEARLLASLVFKTEAERALLQELIKRRASN